MVAALLATRFAEAAELLAALVALLGRFPSLLRDFVPSAHMLLGEGRPSGGRAGGTGPWCCPPASRRVPACLMNFLSGVAPCAV